MNAHMLILEVNNFPNFTQLQFGLELIKTLIGDFSSRKHNVKDGAVHLNHWPVPMTKARWK